MVNPIDVLGGGKALQTNGVEPKPESAKKAAQDFEGILLQQMLQTMWQSVPKGNLFGGDLANDFYYDLYHEAVATSIAEGRGIGVKEVLERDLIRQEEDKTATNDAQVKGVETSQG